MSEQHDDPLRSPVHTTAENLQQQVTVASPTTPASQASPSAPFMTPGSIGPTSDSQHRGPSSQGNSRQNGPRSSYYVGPPGKDSAFGTAPLGVIGRDKPREIVR